MAVTYYVHQARKFLPWNDSLALENLLVKTREDLRQYPAFETLDHAVVSVDVCHSQRERVSGCTLSPGWIVMTVNPSRGPIFPDGELEIQDVFTHELYHLARLQAAEKRHKNRCSYLHPLVRRMGEEGLAMSFGIQCGFPIHESLWALNKFEWRAAARKARALVDQGQSVDVADWEEGNKDKGIKKWTLYALGFPMIQTWLDERRMTAADAVTVSLGEMMGDWTRRKTGQGSPWSWLDPYTARLPNPTGRGRDRSAWAPSPALP